MVGAANALNISQQGLVAFDGVSVFTGVPFSTLGFVLTSNGPGTNPTFQAVAGGGVTSIAGTANQITASASTGAVTLSTPSTFIAPGSIAATTTVTATLGNVIITAGDLTLPASTGSVGRILINGGVFLNSYGGGVFLGPSAGNTSNSSNRNVGIGNSSLSSCTGGEGNVAVGNACLLSCVNGSENVAIGYNTLISATGGSNTACGSQALGSLTSGTNNSCYGWNSGINLVGGSQNCAFGLQSLNLCVSGTLNACFGYGAGGSLTTNDSNNINIQNPGVAGDNGTIKIGTNGTHTTCFLQGISGVTVTGTAVICSTTGQLGTVVSSIRYKENVKHLSDSVSVLDLEPVQFNYISDEKKTTQYGLIAEDVNRDFPYLCFYNEKNEPESVKYHELPVLLLAEIQRLNARLEALEKK